MHNFRVLLLAASTGALLGCGDLYRVSVHDAANPKGIPFYTMSGACAQQSVYANPYYLVTLKVSAAAGPISADTVKLSPVGRSSADFRALLDELDKPQPELASVQTAWSSLKQRQSFDPYSQSAGEFLLDNSSKAVTLVDYAHEYDLNQRKPLAGSTSADYKLGPDGTLTEAQGQVQNDTLSTILSALPLSDLIKSAAGIAAKTGAAAAEPPSPVKFSLEQEERLKTTTYSIVSTYAANCPTGEALTEKITGASKSIADIGARESTKTTGKEDTAISISGTINLPKALLSGGNTDQSTNKPDSGSSKTGGDKANQGASTDKKDASQKKK